MIAPTETISAIDELKPSEKQVKPGVRLIFATYTLFAIALSLGAIIFVYSSIYLSLGLIFITFPIAVAVSLPAAMIIQHRYEIGVFSILIALSLCAPILIARWDYWIAFIELLILNVSMIALVIGTARLLLCWMDRSFATTIVILIALLWITFPLWGSHLMIGHSNDRWLIFTLDIHPVIASNAAYLSLGEWAHEKFAYRFLSNLGQDVNYSFPPGGAIYSILFHGALSIAMIFMPIKSRPRS